MAADDDPPSRPVRVLLTGARGFVGPFVADALKGAFGNDVHVVPTARESGEHAALGTVAALDVTDYETVEAGLLRYCPTHVIHLAGIAAPAQARADPERAWKVHLGGALNLSRAILGHLPECCLIHVGSGMIYGETAASGLPLDEGALVAPVDPYTATKAAADLAIGAAAHDGLRCVRLRPFNHTGPGQSAAFVIPAFAMQLARIEAGLEPPIVNVGNLDAERDFLDVRDIAAAYALAVGASAHLDPGIVLNIASGVPRRIGDILEQLLSLSAVKPAICRDPGRQRPSEVRRFVGDARRARELLGWTPQHGFAATLRSVLDDCRRAVRAGG